MSVRSRWPPGIVCWAAVICPDDDERAKAFYGALFGWEFENIAAAEDPPFYIATLHQDRVSSIAGSGNGEPGQWITALSVSDRERAAAAVNAAGGSAPPDDTTEIASIGRFHRVHDPADAEIHLVEIDGILTERVDEPGAWAASALLLPGDSAVAAFYRTVFGWQLEQTGAAGVFRLPGYAEGGAHASGARDVVAELRTDAGGAPRWMPIFRVADVKTASEAAKTYGGQVIDGLKNATSEGHDVVLADPGGAIFMITDRPARL